MEEIAHNVACPDCFERSVRSVIVKRHTDTRVKMQCVECDYIGHEESNICNLLGQPFTKILLQCLQQQDKRMNEPIKKKTRKRVVTDTSYSPGAY